eukprot:TRINITY_DN888_c0_g2_i2.p1 TRINITY_DN888_c0_g2~~TRINITY_DN888_c0_g2_i2.p1  ORF type:complete len:166 (+),score=64.35 TRINITY_DN888_c0_g2_i2:23-499(+)
MTTTSATTTTSTTSTTTTTSPSSTTTITTTTSSSSSPSSMDYSSRPYFRSAEEIEQEGKKRKVMAGIHFKKTDLYLGRYQISPEVVQLLTSYRKSAEEKQITVPAYDTILKVNVNLRHSHHFLQHQQETMEMRKEKKRFLRSSTLSTNDHLLVLPSPS